MSTTIQPYDEWLVESHTLIKAAMYGQPQAGASQAWGPMAVCCDDSTLLHVAILRGMYGVAYDLLHEGADANAEDGDGCRPLHHAARLGARFMVADLLGSGQRVDPNAKDDMGRTPLHHAVRGLMRHDHEDYAAIIRFLIRRGADVEAKDNHGMTAYQTLAAEVAHLPNASVISKRFPDC
ncbi:MULTISPECIES: ankyrin repeat domain-containing protein [Burkholderiaceae]|jgi:ankyrin repeat protein|uniref:ankyrin repeat domain-containing protein n=1 Tax=Burkholderiaceae TaxID=119060 RepID=UPI001041578C|nr:MULTISPECIES: ankyrin repeat domain-containing protein [Burkholderiaceae]MCI1041785.1 ankyrin repeat domain-containing protein [Caballeronia zhejiangensis]